MPTCSSSVARARQSRREGAMTTRALDAHGTLTVAGPVARQPAHEGTATRPEALAALLARQRTAFLRNGPPSLVERRAALKKLRAACSRDGRIWKRRSMRTSATARGTRPRSWKCSHSRGASTTCTRTCAASCGANAGGVALPMRFARAHVEYQPLGVVGIVAPWNYPMSLALMPLATALAAGNRAMIKPSELTPATSEVLVALVAETFSEDEVAVVTGDASIGAPSRPCRSITCSSPGAPGSAAR